jgi:hypothetical protein
MDNLLDKDIYKEKLNEYIINSYIEKIQYVITDILSEKNNFDLIYINIGIKTIFHVITNIFINTKNIDTTVYHGKLSINYYIEFLKQINSNNINSFIHLTLKDAILFVYKKTIFNLNSEYNKTYKNKKDDIMFYKIFKITTIINNLHIYNNYDPIKYKPLISNLLNISNDGNLDCVENVINNMIKNDITLIKIINFIVSISKKKCTKINNLYKFDFSQDFSNTQLINYLLST